MACTPPPTSSTSIAPNFFNVALSTAFTSLTETRKRVIQASTFSIFSALPYAAIILYAFSVSELVSCSRFSSVSSPRPGVITLKMRIKKTKEK